LSDKTKTFVLPNDLSFLKEVRQFVKETLAETSLVEDVTSRVILAVDEAVSNIIEHAYEEGRKDRIEMAITHDDKRVDILIRDFGKTFDPGKIAPPDMQEYIRVRRKGGLGIFLIRKIMDEVEYTFKEGVQNELRLVKYIQDSGEGESGL